MIIILKRKKGGKTNLNAHIIATLIFFNMDKMKRIFNNNFTNYNFLHMKNYFFIYKKNI